MPVFSQGWKRFSKYSSSKIWIAKQREANQIKSNQIKSKRSKEKQIKEMQSKANQGKAKGSRSLRNIRMYSSSYSKYSNEHRWMTG